DAGNCVRGAVDAQDRADHGRIQSETLLPRAIAHHGPWCCGWRIVARSEQPASRGMDTEHLEVVARHELAFVRLGGRIARAANAQILEVGRKGGELFEFGCVVAK